MELLGVGGRGGREPRRGRPAGLRHLARRVARATSGVGRRDHQRLRGHRPVRVVPVVGPGRAGRVVDDLPPGSIARGAGEGPTCRRPLLDRSHRCARRAGRRHARACSPVRARTSTARRYEALGTIPARVCRYLGWEYGEHEPLQLAANAADTLAPHRRLPVRRRLRVDDVDTAAARRDALGARRRHPPRGVRPSRRVREPGDQGDPRHRAVPVVVRAHAGGGHRGGAGRGLAVRRRVLARRGAGGRPPAPARVLDRVRRPDASGPCCCPAPRTGTPRAAGSITVPRRRAGRADQRQRCGRRAPAGAPGDRAGPCDRSRGASAARGPGPRLHHGVVRSLRHPAARRSRRRGDPGREPVGVPAHHQGLPPAAEPDDAARQPPLDVRAAGRRCRWIGRTTVTR